MNWRMSLSEALFSTSNYLAAHLTRGRLYGTFMLCAFSSAAALLGVRLIPNSARADDSIKEEPQAVAVNTWLRLTD
jgi:hypothetical protein